MDFGYFNIIFIVYLLKEKEYFLFLPLNNRCFVDKKEENITCYSTDFPDQL
jgi:hypothetical protein